MLEASFAGSARVELERDMRYNRKAVNAYLRFAAKTFQEERKLKEPTLIIMAAGMGSRYGGLKQMDPITDKGEIILDFSLYDAVMSGFKKAIFIIKKEMEKDFRELIEGKADKHIEVSYAFQELEDLPEGYQVPEGRVKPWGTSHAVLSARYQISGPFCVINADDYYGPSVYQTAYDYLIQAQDDAKYRYAMIGYEIENTLTEHGSVARGVCEVDSTGHLMHIEERTRIMWRNGDIAFTEDDGESWTSVPRGTPVSMNFWCFTESFMRELENRFTGFLKDNLQDNPLKCEWLLPRTVDALVKEGKASVRVLKSYDQWHGVTYKEDKEPVSKALQRMKDKSIYPEKLWT